MREMWELVDTMNSKVNRLIAPSSTSSPMVQSSPKTQPTNDTYTAANSQIPPYLVITKVPKILDPPSPPHLRFLQKFTLSLPAPHTPKPLTSCVPLAVQIEAWTYKLHLEEQQFEGDLFDPGRIPLTVASQIPPLFVRNTTKTKQQRSGLSLKCYQAWNQNCAQQFVSHRTFALRQLIEEEVPLKERPPWKPIYICGFKSKIISGTRLFQEQDF